MKSIFKSIAIVALFGAILTSCAKYEEGPAFSLHSKKARLSGEWTLEAYLFNTTDQTSAMQGILGASFLMDIEKDEKYTITSSFGTETGTWELGEDKDDIRMTSSQAGSSADTYRILKLKNKELWWKQTLSNGDVEEWHFKQ